MYQRANNCLRNYLCRFREACDLWFAKAAKGQRQDAAIGKEIVARVTS